MNKREFSRVSEMISELVILENRIRELEAENERLRTQLVAVRNHWEFGVDEETEEKSPWHQKMRELLARPLGAG